MLGIFFSAKSAVLIEDVPFTEEDIRNEWVTVLYLESLSYWLVLSKDNAIRYLLISNWLVYYIYIWDCDGYIFNILGIFLSAMSKNFTLTPCYLVLYSKNPPQTVYGLYNQVGINCFIAAAIYVGVGAVSLCQVRLNKRQEYMVT